MTLKVTNKQLRSYLHNPLLLVNGVREIPAEYRHPENDIFDQAYAAALEQTSTENLAWGFTMKDSKEDSGYGGFYNDGFNAPFFGPFEEPRKNWKKDFEYYWPKSVNGYMRYVGAVNLGMWPIILQKLTEFEFSKNLNLSLFMAGGDSYDMLSLFLRREYWLHLFMDCQDDYESPNQDCHVRIVRHHKEDKRNFSDDDIRGMIGEWNQKASRSEIQLPDCYFAKPQFRFFYDGLKLAKDKDWESEKGIFEYGGEFQLFGRPRTQQESRRPLSPHSYIVPHALSPIFAFTESRDVTHQFFADSLLFDSIRHRQYYCKLDSSCT